jgi:hypothetical protein
MVLVLGHGVAWACFRHLYFSSWTVVFLRNAWLSRNKHRYKTSCIAFRIENQISVHTIRAYVLSSTFWDKISHMSFDDGCILNDELMGSLRLSFKM